MAGYEPIHRMSVANPARLKAPGYLPRLIAGGRLARINTIAWQGRSLEADPRQLVFTFSTGNHPHAHVTRLGPPKMFWESIGSDRTGSGWALGRFPWVAGKPTGPVQWYPLSASEVPSLAGGILARVNSEFGAERGHENIVAQRAEGRDVIVSHVSKGQDRQLVVINPTGWDKSQPERQALIEQLDAISLTDIERTELSSDGNVLTLYSSILDKDGFPFEHKLDISSLKINPKGIYSNPEDSELSVKIIVIDPLEDFECLERNRVTILHNQAIEVTDNAVVRGFKEEDGTLHVVIEPRIEEDLGAIAVWGSAIDGGVKITVSTREANLEIKAADEGEIRNHPLFLEQPSKIQDSILRVFQSASPIEVKGKTRREIIKQLRECPIPKNNLRAAKKVLIQTFNLDNFQVDRVTEMRPRYALQFYQTRETRFKKVLDRPLSEGESVVVTKVLSAGEIVHLDGTNGRQRGDREVVPFNFKLSKDVATARLDPRPHAMYSTIFCSPVDTAIAGQHLIDPYVMGTEIMAAVWPKVDQLGFFGVFMSAAMAFPHGGVFTDPTGNPWYVRHFGTLSHSIFDAKADAGTNYHWFSGSPRLSKELVGAAMVTGPNTDTANPVREGRLFGCRLPGRTGVIKTAIPGFYIMVIEDAESSYYFMTMFGLKTETTILPLSAGGGLDNYQLALTIQRSMRWNAGKDIYLMDAALNMWIDFVRGNPAYRLIYDHASKLFSAEVSLETSPRRDALGGMLETVGSTPAVTKQAFAPHRPVEKMYKKNEAREWLNVGTWYFVSAAKLISYLSVPILVLAQVLPIPVAGLTFLFASLATTLFSWPFWAIQMAKVGVNPKTILSFSPIHLFWGDIPMHTMFKSGLDIERMGLGRFRISDKRLGNRIPARDKRTAFWIGGALPTLFGASLVISTAILATAVGIVPIAMTAFPFTAGLILSRILGRLAKRHLPNPNSKSFFKSFVHFTAKSAPVAAGIIASLGAPSFAVYAIPISLALMAGGWAIFMGLNIFNEFRLYHNEQKKNFALPVPNSPAGTIKEYQADTWRNTLQEAFGFNPPSLLPYEFTGSSNPDLDPYKLWAEVNEHTEGLLAKPNPTDPLANLNSLINGEGDDHVMADLYEELRHLRPPSLDNLSRAQVKGWDPLSWPDLFTRRGKIARLVKKTQADRDRISNLQRPQRSAKELHLTGQRYDRLRELNRLVLEETYPEFTPRGSQ